MDDDLKTHTLVYMDGRKRPSTSFAVSVEARDPDHALFLFVNEPGHENDFVTCVVRGRLERVNMVVHTGWLGREDTPTDEVVEVLPGQRVYIEGQLHMRRVHRIAHRNGTDGFVKHKGRKVLVADFGENGWIQRLPVDRCEKWSYWDVARSLRKKAET